MTQLNIQIVSLPSLSDDHHRQTESILCLSEIKHAKDTLTMTIPLSLSLILLKFKQLFYI